MNNKRGMSKWIWIIIILIIIIVGVVIYSLLSGGDSVGSILGGSSIPQPPALPS